jgi:hypothetical protein
MSRSTSGDHRWEGLNAKLNAKPRCRTLVLAGWTLKAANPKWGLGGRAGGRSPKDPARTSLSSAPDDTAPHPAEAGLWEPWTW